jgi:hypothetical protein
MDSLANSARYLKSKCQYFQTLPKIEKEEELPNSSYKNPTLP